MQEDNNTPGRLANGAPSFVGKSLPDAETAAGFEAAVKDAEFMLNRSKYCR